MSERERAGKKKRNRKERVKERKKEGREGGEEDGGGGKPTDQHPGKPFSLLFLHFM